MTLFQETYNRIRDYYLLNEDVMSEVPRRLLGMHTNVQGLPNEQPYGFWMDRSGNFIEVPWCGHEGIGKQILEAAKNFLKKKGIKYTPASKETYSALFALGWARVVVSDYANAIEYEMGKGEFAHTASTSQMKMMNFMKEFYEKNRVIRY